MKITVFTKLFQSPLLLHLSENGISLYYFKVQFYRDLILQIEIVFATNDQANVYIVHYVFCM